MGLWHTGICIYEKEYYFGGEGIQEIQPVCLFCEQIYFVGLSYTRIHEGLYTDDVHFVCMCNCA